MVRSIGADHVIDYTKENFTQNGKTYDLILAANGYHPLSDYKRALTPEGTYVCTGGTLSQLFQAMLLGSLVAMGSNKKLLGVSAKSNQNDLIFLAELFQNKKIMPVIDKCYPLSEAAEGFRYLGEGHAQGKVIIKVL